MRIFLAAVAEKVGRVEGEHDGDAFESATGRGLCDALRFLHQTAAAVARGKQYTWAG